MFTPPCIYSVLQKHYHYIYLEYFATKIFHYTVHMVFMQNVVGLRSFSHTSLATYVPFNEMYFLTFVHTGVCVYVCMYAQMHATYVCSTERLRT